MLESQVNHWKFWSSSQTTRSWIRIKGYHLQKTSWENCQELKRKQKINKQLRTLPQDNWTSWKIQEWATWDAKTELRAQEEKWWAIHVYKGGGKEIWRILRVHAQKIRRDTKRLFRALAKSGEVDKGEEISWKMC